MVHAASFDKIEEYISKITLKRPNAANSLSIQMVSELDHIVSEIKNDPTVRCVIIIGQGTKAFCAGADLKERASMNEKEVRQTLDGIRQMIERIASLPQPVIAAINGAALGGGTELALACDLRIASEHAYLGLTETSLGIIPGAGGTQRLPRLFGKGRAKELIYTARKVTAQESLKIGLVEYVSKAEELEKDAVHLAEKIVRNAPIAVTQAKFAIDKGSEVDLLTGLALERKAYEITIPTKDRQEGLKAFKEKRTPSYKGE
ncbi:enoyl-CoA hydratase [Metabacillus halosaccharovorans]|uniref:enoyl-CoA hydratase n=1 Tax=Metabacillus halosaccharovorans TaxID=930124 RepID=UPI00203AE571|nr:enoyl-CoA hydratase [Metabacillus halosaccharovorans]MCM3442276.1 enoyl-CoA hydratase [Metabacillus halosaccharovorans]